MKRLTMVMLVACAARPTTKSVTNHAIAETQRCVDDRKTDDKIMTFYVSADDRDPRPADPSFERTWQGQLASFDHCRGDGSLPIDFVGVRFTVTRSGGVTDVTTMGPDAKIDACVCDAMYAIHFPPQSPPVTAVMAVEVQ